MFASGLNSSLSNTIIYHDVPAILFFSLCNRSMSVNKILEELLDIPCKSARSVSEPGGNVYI